MKNTWRFGDRELHYLREVVDSGFGSGTSGSMLETIDSVTSQPGGRQARTTQAAE